MAIASCDCVHEAFVGEHRITEGSIMEMRAMAREGLWPQLQEMARQLSVSMQGHINVEEAYIYPHVDKLAQQDEALRRTLAVLRKRHLEIPNYILEIASAADERDLEEAEESIGLLTRVLADHHRSEEAEIFPLFAPTGPLAEVRDAAARALLGRQK